MKRHLVLGAVLAALVGVTSTSWALDVNWGGDYRIRGFYIDNLTDGDSDFRDSAAYYSSRFMLTTTATQDGVSGVVTLLAGSQNATGNRLLGDGTGSLPGAADDDGFAFGPTGTSVEILEAYIKADFKTWALTGGRAGLKFGNGVIMDDWVDGIWADLGLGGMTLTVGTAKFDERTDNNAVFIGNSTPGGPGVDSGPGDDADLYFVNAGLGKTGAASGTNVFLLYLMDRSTLGLDPTGALGIPAGQEATVWTLGAATELDMNGLKLKGEFDYLNGTYKPLTGSDIDLQGYNLVLGAKMDAGGIPLGVDLIYTSGQDNNSTSTDGNINGLSGNYPIGIIITNSGARSAGVTDGTCVSVGGTNTYSGGSGSCLGGDGLTAIKVSTGMTHGAHTIDLAAIWAQATEDPFDFGSGLAPDQAGYDAGTDLGIELDATVTWSLTKNLSLMGGVGYLLAGDYFKSLPNNSEPNGATDDLVVLVAQLGYTF
ncbi:MAG: hypothetical protein AB1451_10490 [Nitrospirota bacterium]